MPADADRRRRAGAFALGVAWALHCTWAAGHETGDARARVWGDVYQQLAASYDVASESPADRRVGVPADRALGLKAGSSSIGLKGFVQAEVARTYANPEHWSKMLLRGELSANGRINEHVKWKLSGRLDY